MAGNAVSGDLLPLASGTDEAICVLRLDGIEFAATPTGGLDVCTGRVVGFVAGGGADVEFDALVVGLVACGGELGGGAGNGDAAGEPVLLLLPVCCGPAGGALAGVAWDVFACD